MKHYHVGTRFAYRLFGQDYFKVGIVDAATGRFLPGRMTIKAYAGKELAKMKAKAATQIARQEQREKRRGER